MTDELELVRRARPEVRPPSQAARVAARQALDDAIANGGERWRRRFDMPLRLRLVAPALGVGVVIAVAAVFLGIRGTKPRGTASAGGLELVFRALPTPRVPVTNGAAMNRTLALVRLRLNAVAPGAQVSAAGDEVLVSTNGGTRVSLDELVALIDAPGQLLFYDWEANVLTPNGHTAASQLQAQDPTAIQISQGSTGPPGSPGSGSMSLYPAVQLAAEQPARVGGTNSRAGSEYFMFGGIGSSTCAAAARYYDVTELPRQRCYLAGPQDSIAALQASLPTGISASASGVQTLAVRQGGVVLQAAPPTFSRPVTWSDPSAQYYVLRDHVSLSGNDITNPQQRTDQSGAPDVTFGFTSYGAKQFQSVTATIAHRGDLVSSLGQTLDQHFAVALDTELITVPSIDFKTYPDGVSGDRGADITGGLTTSTARQLAAELRLGALPVHLTLVSVNGH